MNEIILIVVLLIFCVLLVSQLIISLKIYRKVRNQHLFLKSKEKEDNFTNEELIEEIKTTVILKMFTIRNAVHKQCHNIHVKAIENAPKSIGINEDLLAQSFSKEKIEKINLFFELTQAYIKNYWVNKNNKFKTVFPGDIEEKTGEVGKLILASEKLLIKLDSLLNEIQETDKND